MTSYKSKIHEAVRNIGTKDGHLENITFKNIAKESGLSFSNIESEYKNMNQIWYDLAIIRYQKHTARSKAISKLKGELALATLIKHDLTLIYKNVEHAPYFKEKKIAEEAHAYGAKYIDNELPKYYFEILRLNSNLIPNKSIDIRLYSKFIVHGLFFYTKKELYDINPNEDEIKSISRQIVSSLFRSM